MLERYPNKVNLVPKHFPLRNHQYARSATLASLAANKQGKYKEMLNVMLKNYKTLNEEKIKTYATELGLDMEKFEQDRKSPEVQAILNEDLKLRARAKVRAVPTIFINGRKVQNRSISGFIQMIEKELSNLPQTNSGRPEKAAADKPAEAAADKPAEAPKDKPAEAPKDKPAEAAKEAE